MNLKASLQIARGGDTPCRKSGNYLSSQLCRFSTKVRVEAFKTFKAFFKKARGFMVEHRTIKGLLNVD